MAILTEASFAPNRARRPRSTARSSSVEHGDTEPQGQGASRRHGTPTLPPPPRDRTRRSRRPARTTDIPRSRRHERGPRRPDRKPRRLRSVGRLDPGDVLRRDRGRFEGRAPEDASVECPRPAIRRGASQRGALRRLQSRHPIEHPAAVEPFHRHLALFDHLEAAVGSPPRDLVETRPGSTPSGSRSAASHDSRAWSTRSRARTCAHPSSSRRRHRAGRRSRRSGADGRSDGSPSRALPPRVHASTNGRGESCGAMSEPSCRRATTWPFTSSSTAEVMLGSDRAGPSRSSMSVGSCRRPDPRCGSGTAACARRPARRRAAPRRRARSPRRSSDRPRP